MNVPLAGIAKTVRRRSSTRKYAAHEPIESVRARILSAATRAFAERGFYGTSVPEIAVSAHVGVGSIYRHFESKERLVNAVFREAKARLRDALLLDFDLSRAPAVMFADLWRRLVAFQRADALAFRFLEMQDHVPYLDAESRAVEASLLAPILLAASRTTGATELKGRGKGDVASHSLLPQSPNATPALLIAIVWGAFVSLTKAERLGYLTLDGPMLARAGEICFAAVAFAMGESVPNEPTTRPRTRKRE